ncbi:MAG: FkbM family methyltransferase [Alphaproteobacteria bacterium]|nr:FkbM family methyltransferase [Alphaproteobacteria bacterium]MBU2270016.1 FkbM family methyltransferase [Alphaproteobacteria bacterium]MBU2417859.1 FkbM family methyltransferase [Alphaproteobacteria bacterium]
MHLTKLRRDYSEGIISRADLRQKTSEEFAKLAAYQEMIAGSDISEISISSSDIIATIKSGVRMYWEVEDVCSAPSIAFAHSSYEPEESHLLFSLAADKKSILDIGANIGWHSLHFGRLTQANGGSVYAIEPIPWTFDRLKRNVELNSLSSVVNLYQLGFGESAGSATFYVPRESGSSAASMRDLHPDEGSQRVDCSIEVVDEFLQRECSHPIDMVKCDVEGAELMVLRGANRLLTSDRPVFFFELLRKWSKNFGYHPNAVIDLLASHGYQCWAVGKGSITRMTEMTEETEETNFLFLADHHEREKLIIEDLAR